MNSSNDSSKNGNQPEKWNSFLSALDEKLQLGLLRRMERVSSYHFEDDILFIEIPSQEDFEYLENSAQNQQLQILAEAALGVEKVKIKLSSS